jgi:hypothetical protein
MAARDIPTLLALHLRYQHPLEHFIDNGIVVFAEKFPGLWRSFKLWDWFWDLTIEFFLDTCKEKS